MLRRKFLTSVVMFALVAPGFATAQASLQERLAGNRRPLVVASRGTVGRVPSNSLAGIRNAIEAGVDMVQVDVQMTREGSYVLMRHPTLSVATNVRDVFPDGAPSLDPSDPAARRHLVADYTLEDIARLRLRDREGGDHPVPTLDEALDLAEGQISMILNLQNWENETLVPILETRSAQDLLLFTTSDEDKLREAAEATGIGVFVPLREATSVSRALDRALDRFGPQLRMVSIEPDQFTQEIREIAAERGVGICLRGFDLDDALLLRNDRVPWEQALAAGADAYITQLPTEVMELLQR